MLSSRWPVVVVSLLLAAVLLPSGALASCANNQTVNTDGYFRPNNKLSVPGAKVLYVEQDLFYYYEGASINSLTVVLDKRSCSDENCNNQLVLGVYNGTSGKLLATTAAASFKTNRASTITLPLRPQLVVPASTVSTPYYFAITTEYAYKIQTYVYQKDESSGYSSHAWTGEGSLPAVVNSPPKQTKAVSPAFQALLCYPEAVMEEGEGGGWKKQRGGGSSIINATDELLPLLCVAIAHIRCSSYPNLLHVVFFYITACFACHSHRLLLLTSSRLLLPALRLPLPSRPQTLLCRPQPRSRSARRRPPL
jgi:hypothetical protein